MICVSIVCGVSQKRLGSLCEISSLKSHFLAYVYFMALSFLSLLCFCLFFVFMNVMNESHINVIRVNVTNCLCHPQQVLQVSLLQIVNKSEL